MLHLVSERKCSRAEGAVALQRRPSSISDRSDTLGFDSHKVLVEMSIEDAHLPACGSRVWLASAERVVHLSALVEAKQNRFAPIFGLRLGKDTSRTSGPSRDRLLACVTSWFS